MNNFYICYNALRRAFEKEGIQMASPLVKILKPNNIVYATTGHTTLNDNEDQFDDTNNIDETSIYESDDSNDSYSSDTGEEHVESPVNENVVYVFS